MTLPVIIGRTAGGGALYAAITLHAPLPGELRPKGIVAHSAEVALLAPFADIEEAAAEIKRLSGGPEPIGLEI